MSRVVSIESEHYFRHPVSSTFHARDIFAPVAAWLSKGIDISKFGPVITEYKRLSLPAVQKLEAGGLQGLVLHIDKFGNIITSFRIDQLPNLLETGRSSRIEVGGHVIEGLVPCYEDGPEGKPFLIAGSSGYLEIAAPKQSAGRLLNLRRGNRLVLFND